MNNSLNPNAKVLKEVQTCVNRLLQMDPSLSFEEHQELLNEMEARLNDESLHNAL